ncbi:hypothetical protein PT277_01295 [Acetobacteraceae bacterium ESL0709]|nr:hypothetical protein [Acetobacteraceae bacterium ESL0697]MDF7677337.1 hypothetical protein [Acetobacteraceae bacterium ESL0709]
MSEKLPIADFVRPKLEKLLHEGLESGFTYGQLVAVLIDLLDDSSLKETIK